MNNKKNAINHFYTKTWPNNSMNGSLLVAKNGYFEKYEGMANFRSKRPITATTPLHLASVSKVTATAILKLIDANKIKLDQKVNTILKLSTSNHKNAFKSPFRDAQLCLFY
jgi:CubicO group peptidase (beta-lactamase class C family)